MVQNRIRKSEQAPLPSPASTGVPVAYLMLWFPLSSETFIFREVENLRNQGLDVRAYTMYGAARRGLSAAMANYRGPVARMGTACCFAIMKAFFRQLVRKPRKVWQLMRRGLFRRMRNLESQAENFWCFLAGFLLAERCQADGIGLIHSAWANGPATAAWVASHLTGIPFAFTGRAGDIYPEDGILAEKAADALFIRTNAGANVDWLAGFCPPGQKDKVKLVYNGLTFPDLHVQRERKPSPPYKLLAVGRFARTKGFPELFTALARLKRENFPVCLTLIGEGSWKRRLIQLRKRLNLEQCIEMPGFLPHDKIVDAMKDKDLLIVPSVVHSNGDRDGIPNVIMEACCVGLPVVATDVCGISEVIRNNETGFLVRQRDPAALAASIREALENPDLARLMSRAADDLVRQMFDPRKNGALLRELYLKALPDGNA